MKFKHVSLSVLILIISIDLLDTTANLVLKKGAGHLNFLYLGIGILLYVFNFILWMKVLSKVDLSIALPLSSASYILVPLTSIFFLHEKVGLLRWVAIGLIISGIYFLAKSNPDKKDQHQ